MADTIPTPQVNYLVQIERSRSAETVAAALRDCGLNVERVMSTVGVVGGHGPRALAPALREVSGVRTVREEGGFQLPPAGSGTPQ